MRYIKDNEMLKVGQYYLGYGSEMWGEWKPDIAYIFKVEHVDPPNAHTVIEYTMSRIYGESGGVFKYKRNVIQGDEDFYEFTDDEILMIIVPRQL